MEVIVGFIIGLVSQFIIVTFLQYFKDRRGKKYSHYKKNTFNSKLRSTLRHIVFEFSIRKNNHDFLLNIEYRGKEIIQLMHRAHFPDLCTNENDVKFGIALYIPISKLSDVQKAALNTILTDEEEFFIDEDIKLQYYVIDLGKRIRYGGYLITRIVKEVFDCKDDFLSLKLFNEGELPYFPKPIISR